jgi:hypothetical protein
MNRHLPLCNVSQLSSGGTQCHRSLNPTLRSFRPTAQPLSTYIMASKGECGHQYLSVNMRFTPSLAIAILALSPSSLARVFNGAADTFDPSVVNFIAVANFGADVINVNLTKVLNAPGDSAGCLAFAKGMQGLSGQSICLVLPSYMSF